MEVGLPVLRETAPSYVAWIPLERPRNAVGSIERRDVSIVGSRRALRAGGKLSNKGSANAIPYPRQKSPTRSMEGVCIHFVTLFRLLLKSDPDGHA